MRENWKSVELDALGDLTSSKRIFKKEYVKEGVPFFRSKEIKELAHNKEISLELFISKERYQQIKSKFGVPKKGDILLTAVGTIGEMYVVKENEEFYFKDGNIMWLKDFKNVNSYYLKYVLTSLIDQIKALSRGSAYNALTIEKLSRYSIPVPPISEQEKIVTVLNEAFAAINQAKGKLEKNIENAKELFQSKLNEIFSQKGEGWKKKRLKEFISISHGYAFKGKDFVKDSGSDNPIVLTPGNFSEHSELYFTQKNTKRFNGTIPEGFLFNKSDLAVVMTDLSSKMKILGKPSFIQSNNILHNQRIGRVIINTEDVLKQFIYYYFQSSDYLKEIKTTSTGTMVRHTAPSRILECIISFPVSKEKQQSYFQELNFLKSSSRKLENTYRQKINELEELKTSLLQKALAGELKQKEVEV